MPIDMNSLLDNQVYQIRIVPPLDSFKYIEGIKDGYIIKGYMTNQITWSSSNQFEGLHSGIRFLKEHASDINKAEQLANEAGVDTGAAQHAMVGITETIARWTGSSKPTFSFNVMFVATSSNKDILTPCKMLIRGCLPHENSGTILKGSMMAPYGYKTGITGEDENFDEAESYWSMGGKLQGTWTVEVGKWFKAPKLVLNSVGINFSQQCTPNGKPLYAEAQLMFETWRLPRANELERFFHSNDMQIKTDMKIET